MEKKILMVYPEFPVTYWSMTHALKYVGKATQFPPLGLLTVAALLPEKYEVRLVDMNHSALDREDLLWCDMVFLSAMIVQKESFEDVVRQAVSAGKKVVAGGPYATSAWETIEGVDHFILNEAEATLTEFLEDLERGETRRVYASERRPDITKTPVPRFDLLNTDRYYSMVLQYSRGCPFNCEFCDIIEMFGRTPRTKTPEQFIGEVEAVYRTGFRGSLFVVDDNFIGNKREAKSMLTELIRWQEEHGHPFYLFTEASVNLADDDELMDLMVRAGFDMVFLGIETPMEETLLLTQKKQNTRFRLLESVRRIQNRGMEVSAGFIIGFDNDPENIFDLQIKFIQESGIPMAMVGLLTAFPLTQLYRRLRRENRILSESSGNNVHIDVMNFRPVMERSKLIEGYKRVLREIYSPRLYFERCRVMLENTRKHRLHNRPLSRRDLRALALSLLRQTFSPYGRHYLGFLWRAAFKGRAAFTEAVTMAIKGEHFFHTTREMLRQEVKSSPVPDITPYVTKERTPLKREPALRRGKSSLGALAKEC